MQFIPLSQYTGDCYHKNCSSISRMVLRQGEVDTMQDGCSRDKERRRRWRAGSGKARTAAQSSFCAWQSFLHSSAGELRLATLFMCFAGAISGTKINPNGTCA